MAMQRKTISKSVKKVVPTPSPFYKGLMPKTFATTLRYHELVFLNPSAGAVGLYVFRANSCFDPNYTGTGHQPMGWDQLSSMFAHYCVVSSRIKAVFAPVAVETALTVAGIQLGADQSVTGAWPVITEQALTNWTPFQGVGSGTVPKLPVVRQKFEAREFFGVKDPNSVREIGALVTTNPVDGAYFNIFLQSADQSSDPQNTNIIIDMEFDVVFSEREEVPGS